MDAHIPTVVRRRAFQRRIYILAENAVAAFVNGGKDGTDGIFGIVVVGKPHVVPGESHGERMLALGGDARVRIEAHIVQEKILDFFLIIRIVIAPEFFTVRLGGRQNFLHQRDQPFFQLFKNPVDGGGIHTLLILVQQHIVHFFSRVGIAALLLCHLNHIFQMGSKQGEVGSFFRFLPGLHGGAAGSDKSLVKIPGDPSALI